MRDWTLGKYAALCAALRESGYAVQRIDEFLLEPAERCVLLRHDVDRQPNNSLEMARLEHRLGIHSTYYVRKTRSAYSDELVRELHELGHEVGYHYEVLSKTGGNVAAALELFAHELDELRRLAPIRTASCHGSPLSRWDSLDLWQHAEPARFDLLGEAYLAIDYSRVAYYTDTGRSWSADGTNLRDRVDAQGRSLTRVPSTDALIGLLHSGAYPQLCIQTHPERWNESRLRWLRSSLFDNAANTAKRGIRLLGRAHAR